MQEAMILKVVVKDEERKIQYETPIPEPIQTSSDDPFIQNAIAEAIKSFPNPDADLSLYWTIKCVEQK